MPESWILAGMRSTPSAWLQDTLAGLYGLVHEDFPHHVRERDGQGIRLGMAQADGEAGLGVVVDKGDLLSFQGQSHAQVYAACRFTRASFLVHYGNDLAFHRHSSYNKICR